MPAKNKRPDFLLDANEQLLWSGRPPRGMMLRSSDLFMIPFSLIWGSFAVLWTLGAALSAGCFGLFGIPFALFAMYLMFGRFWVDAYLRQRTRYALTDKRIIISGGLFSEQFTSVNLCMVTQISLKIEQSGKGTITFGPISTNWQFRGIPINRMSPTFESIRNARQVYSRILEAQQANSD